MIPYGKQTIDQADIDAVAAALSSDYLTTGPLVKEFEARFAEFVGAKYAVAVANATDALHLAMLVAGVTKGDRVVTSPNTFLSSANCAAFVGATPDFADIDAESYNLCPKSLATNWKDDTKAVVVVDYAGMPANLPEISKIARDNGAIVIEDACHGTGGAFKYNGHWHQLGGNEYVDMATFSFHPVKTMTTGEGGMLVTDNLAFAEKARKLRMHGMSRSPEEFLGFNTGNPRIDEVGPWVYEMQELGYNHRITDFQCALGLSQLKKLPQFISRRNDIIALYDKAFSDCEGIITPHVPDWIEDSSKLSRHLYTVQVDFEQLGMSRTEFMSTLRAQGIGCLLYTSDAADD